LTDAELRAKAEKVMEAKLHEDRPLNFVPATKKFKNVKLFIY